VLRVVAVGDSGGVPDKNVLRRAFDDLQDGRHSGRQGVPLPAAPEPEFDVIVPPAGVLEVRPDVVAEVALDFEDESGGSPPRVRGLPREELPGEGEHAGGGLSGTNGTEDGDPGIQTPLGEREPGGAGDFRGSVGWWSSPTTREGELSSGDVGQRGWVPRPKRRDYVREPNQRR